MRGVDEVLRSLAQEWGPELGEIAAVELLPAGKMWQGLRLEVRPRVHGAASVVFLEDGGSLKAMIGERAEVLIDGNGEAAERARSILRGVVEGRFFDLWSWRIYVGGYIDGVDSPPRVPLRRIRRWKPFR